MVTLAQGSRSHLGIEVPALAPSGAGEAIVGRSPWPHLLGQFRGRGGGSEVRLYPLPSVERLITGRPGGCDGRLNIL